MNKKNSVSNGIKWSAIEKLSMQGMQFAIQLVLARLLDPADYGLVGMLLIFINLGQAIVDGGFSSALIQKRNSNETDFSTVFYFNFFLSIILYVLLFLSAAAIASFYGYPKLELLVKVIGLNIILSSLTVVHRSKISKDLGFKLQAKVSFFAVIFSGLIGIWLAYAGFNYWSLVFQSLINNFLLVILFWKFLKWKPLLKFSFNSFNNLFGFGWKIFVSGLLSTFAKDIYTVFIGKFYNPQQLGYYTRAKQFYTLPSGSIANIVTRVAFPVFCKIQHKKEELRNVYGSFVQKSSLVVFPIMTGMMILAEPMIQFLLGEKWILSVPILQILCLYGALQPIYSLTAYSLNATGRSDLFLKLEIIYYGLMILLLFITVRFGIYILVFGQVISIFATVLVGTHYTNKMFNYNFLTLTKDISKVLLICLVMGFLVYCSSYFLESSIMKLIVGGIVGLISYLILCDQFGFFTYKDIKLRLS